jgi:hypothetical protein
MKLNNFLIYFKVKKRKRFKTSNQHPSWASEEQRTCKKNERGINQKDLGIPFVELLFQTLHQGLL